MSVGEEQTECPLCMEPLELDDINFFPCTCGYQICRFCWHRIRTDENGLCPACRKQYPEDPAEFKPLTDDELQRIKKERRQKDLQRKQKAAENRKHLANVRVVQKNLVFVVGLSQRLADPEVLKKNEYFGKFGKIHKVVINHSTSYAGAQGPSASAYVTYQRPEDTLRAIQAVNNIHVDGRTLKASLGTTKYCSHFLRGSQCPKPDCMYLHELGEEAASFTKEEMQQGKHQEYEQNLYEQFMNCQNLSNNQPAASTATTTATTTTSTTHSNKSQRKKTGSPQTISDGSSQEGGSSAGITPTGTPPTTCKEAWPSLGGVTSSLGGSPRGSGSPETVVPGGRGDRGERGSQPAGLSNGNKAKSKHDTPSSSCSTSSTTDTDSISSSSTTTTNRAPGHHRTKHNSGDSDLNSKGKSGHHSNGTQNNSDGLLGSSAMVAPSLHTHHHGNAAPGTRVGALYGGANDSMSLFSSGTSGYGTSGFGGSSRQHKPVLHPATHTDSIPTAEIPDTIPVASSTDWQAAFGFTSASVTLPTPAPPTDCHIDDDLGFDPWDESSKALADLIEKEGAMTSFPGFPVRTNTNPPPGLHNHHVMPPAANHHPSSLTKSLPPPGLAPPPNHMAANHHMNHMGAFNTSMPPPPTGFSGSKILGMMQMSGGAPMPPPNMHVPNNHGFNDLLGDVTSTTHQQQKHSNPPPQQNNDAFNMKDWQEGLRALLPNINIHFGTPPYGGTSNTSAPPPPPPPPHTQQHSHTQHTRSDWFSDSEQLQKPPGGPPADLSWDPAIVTSGNIATDAPADDATPHWMASLQHLTEESSNHRLPFVQQFPTFNTGVNWAAQSQHPPPGFQPAQLRQHSQTTEPHTQLEAGVQ